MKSNTTAHEEEVRSFSDRYIDSIKSPDGHVLRSNCKMRDAVWAHFHVRFARCPDLPLQVFCSYLADFPRLGAAKEASCEGVVTGYEVCEAVKKAVADYERIAGAKVNFDKSKGLWLGALPGPFH